MFGHGCLVGGAGFGAGAGVVDVLGVELVGAAAAPAMPTAAPPAASAPAIIPALSILEMCMG